MTSNFNLPDGMTGRESNFFPPYMKTCEACFGSGEIPADDIRKLTLWEMIKGLFIETWDECPACKGYGEVEMTNEEIESERASHEDDGRDLET